MHILFKSSEREDVQRLKLPQGTTLVESNTEGTPLARWIVKGTILELEADFVERDRGWKKGEQDAFLKGMTKERVFDFFLKQSEGDGVPQREYSLMSGLEHKFFKFIAHSGSYIRNKKTGEQQNMFRISLNKDSDIAAAKKEVAWMLPQIAQQFPNWDPIHIGVFEHTLSEGGIYTVQWDRNSTFVLAKCTYGRNSEEYTTTKLTDLLKYIAANHYYQEKTKA